MEYYTEKITEKNFHSFLKVFKESFNLEIEERYFKNKFDTIYTSHNVIGFIAFENINNSPVAFCGVFPTVITVNGKKSIAAQCGDLGTLPSHRKKGLFKLLHDLTMEQCKKDGISFVFAFPYPNSSSYLGFKKFGWYEEDMVVNIIRVNETKFISRLIRKFSPSLSFRIRKLYFKKNTLSLEEIEKIAKSGTIFSDDKSRINIPRTFSYLKYKRSIGSIFLNLKNGVVWISIKGDKIEIGDIFGNDINKILNDLIRFSEIFAFRHLSIRTSNEKLKTILLSEFGFREDHRHHLVINYLNENISKDNFNYTGGDLDFFGI